MMRTSLPVTASMAAVVLVGSAGAASAAPPQPKGQDRAALIKECAQNFAAYGFPSTGACVRHVNSGGALVPPPPPSSAFTFTLVALTQEAQDHYVHDWRIEASGLKPNSSLRMSYVSGAAGTVHETTYQVASDGTFVSVVGYRCYGDLRDHRDVYLRGLEPDGDEVRSPELDPCPA